MMYNRVVNLHRATAHTAHLERQIDIFVIAKKALVKAANSFEMIAAVGGGGGAGAEDRKVLSIGPDGFAIAGAVGDAKNRQLVTCAVKRVGMIRGNLHRPEHGHKGIAVDCAVQGGQPIWLGKGVGVQCDDPVGPGLDGGNVISCSKAEIFVSFNEGKPIIQSGQGGKGAIDAAIIDDKCLKVRHRLRG